MIVFFIRKAMRDDDNVLNKKREKKNDIEWNMK